MAHLKSPFGKFSGSIGNLVFRTTPGKGNIVAAATDSYNTPTDQEAVSRRTKSPSLLSSLQP